MFSRESVREGMAVYSNDGEKLGKVFVVESDAFHIEKGFFFPKDYLARFSDIREITDDAIYLSKDKGALLEGAEAWREPTRDTGVSREASTMQMGSTSETMGAISEERRIPIVEEELDIQKRREQAGELRVEKRVETEMQTVSVPVQRETVQVERVPVSDTGRAGQTPNEGTISIPLSAEEVEVTKRPVVKEEVRVRKGVVQSEQRVAENLRREEAEIRAEGDVTEERGGIRGPAVDEHGIRYGSPDDDLKRRS